MENSDLEKKLKESADKIEMKDFSIRLASIKEKLKTQEPTKEIVLSEEAISISASENVTFKSNRKTKFYFIIVSFVFFVSLVLAIVLPITLRNNKTRFFTMNEISVSFVSKEEFYGGIEGTNLNIIDLSDWSVDNYKLVYAPDGTVIGGGFELNDDTLGLYLIVSFYGANVITEFTTDSDYININVGSSKVSYKTTFDEIFKTEAIIDFNDIKYNIECMALEDNFLDLIQQLLD